MNTVLVQTVIVGACVASAVVYVLARYLPRRQIANWLDARGHVQFAALLRPAKGGGGCHSGGDDGACGSCGSCGTSKPNATQASVEQPVRFHPAKR